MTISSLLTTIAQKDFRNYAKYIAVQAYNCLYTRQTYRLPASAEDIVRGYDTCSDIASLRSCPKFMYIVKQRGSKSEWFGRG